MKTSFTQNALIHGLVIGLALIVLSVADWMLGFYGQNTAFMLLTYLVIIGGLLWSGFSYRKELGGYISFGKIFVYSLVVALVFSLLASIFSLLLTTVIDPNYTNAIMDMMEQKMLDSNLSQMQVDTAMEVAGMFKHPAISFIAGLFSTIFTAAFIALITSAIIKRNNDNPFKGETTLN